MTDRERARRVIDNYLRSDTVPNTFELFDREGLEARIVRAIQAAKKEMHNGLKRAGRI